MSEHTTEQLQVAASPEACWAVATDLERYPEWVADLKQVTVLERDGEGRPVLVAFRAAAFGRSTSYTLRYDYAEAPEVLSWQQTEGDLTSRLDGSYTFKPSERGTEVVYDLTADLKVPIPGFIKSRAQGRIQATALRELRARVESIGS